MNNELKVKIEDKILFTIVSENIKSLKHLIKHM